jgi:ribosomal protein S27E
MEKKLSFVQRLFKSLPGQLGNDMEAESRNWMATCNECGTAESMWDRGGIRWGAAGKPRTRLKCPSCGRVTWHTVAKQ